MAVTALPSSTRFHARSGLGLAARASRLVRLWRLKASDRRAFADLGERDLHDLGMTRWHVERELAKPFWRG
jgi:uncharacterized protein YjiS (DUF1127 family)